MPDTPLIDLEIEQRRPEWPKYTAEIVLVAGLWCPAAVWRPLMGYLAHRGWECTALAFRAAPDAGWQAHQDALQGHLATIEASPIVIGHDTGASLALASEARARIALAPLLAATLAPGGHPALSRWRLPLSAWRRQPLAPPVGPAAESVFGHSIPAAPRDDSPSFARDLLRPGSLLPARSASPALLVSAADDPVTPADRVARLAATLGVDSVETASAGHGLPWGSGWEPMAGALHRWLIRTLGEPLLAMLDEEE